MSVATPRRILMTGDTVGGVWTFILELARHLASHGTEVCLATFGAEPTPAQLEEATAVAGLRLTCSPLKLEWMEDPWSDVEKSRRWLSYLAEAFQPDLVHLNTYAHA